MTTRTNVITDERGTDPDHDRDTCTEPALFSLTMTRHPEKVTEENTGIEVEIRSHAHGGDELRMIVDVLDGALDVVKAELHERILHRLMPALRDSIAGILHLDPEDVQRMIDDEHLQVEILADDDEAGE